VSARGTVPPSGAIVLLGATSGIARAAAEIWAARGEELILAGRNPQTLEALAKDLGVACGKQPETFVWDFADTASAAERCEALFAGREIRGLLLAAGVLHMPEDCAVDPSRVAETFHVNLTAPALLCELFAARLAGRAGAFLSVITSVAGDRVRASNYQYGASKAGLSGFLSGLRARLRVEGSLLLVQDVRPGPVRTRMTARFKSGPLQAEPESAARDIVRAVDAGRELLYTPFFWRWIMFVIRSLPEPLFRRLKL
jgi:short-subunit dehydrogenase